jgi:hypothetical protein
VSGAAALDLRRAANWRQILLGGPLAVLVTGIPMGRVLDAHRLTRRADTVLRARRDQLQSRLDLLSSRGGKADFRTCGVRATHTLCERVDPRLGRIGGYRILKKLDHCGAAARASRELPGKAVDLKRQMSAGYAPAVLLKTRSRSSWTSSFQKDWSYETRTQLPQSTCHSEFSRSA